MRGKIKPRLKNVKAQLCAAKLSLSSIVTPKLCEAKQRKAQLWSHQLKDLTPQG